MKRVVIIFIAMIFSMTGTMIVNAVTVDDCFKEFLSEPNVQHVKIGSALMWVIKKSIGNGPEGKLIKKFDSMRVLRFKNCEDTVKNRFANRMKNISIDGMEELADGEEDGRRVRILTLTKEGKISKMLVICYGIEDYSLIEINGKFDINDIEDVAKSQLPKK